MFLIRIHKKTLHGSKCKVCHTGCRTINVGEKEIKVSLYADHTTVFVRDLDSVDHLLTHLDNFKNLSGLEIINNTRSEGMWLGQWKNKTKTPFRFR